MTDFCFVGGEGKCITVNGLEACVKNVEDIVICLIKQQIKNAVAYLLFHYFLTFCPSIFCQIINISMGFDPAPFFASIFL